MPSLGRSGKAPHDQNLPVEVGGRGAAVPDYVDAVAMQDASA